MDNQMNIEISQLRSVLNMLLDYIEHQGGKTVHLDADAYWFISRDTVFDPYTESTELSMGQLSDDWESLKKILDKKEDPIGYAAVWASTLLRAIGERVP